MTLRLLFLLGSSCGAVFAADLPEILRLDVYPVHLMKPMEVHSIVTNVSDKPVTIPTSSYSGGVDGWASGHLNIGIFFSIGFDQVGKYRLVPAPTRFHPVTLLPGESAELPVTHPTLDQNKTVEVTFAVDRDYAERFGWWYGCLQKKVVIGEGDNPYVVSIDDFNARTINPPEKKTPNKVPEPTPVTVTPAADAPVAPATGAAQR